LESGIIVVQKAVQKGFEVATNNLTALKIESLSDTGRYADGSGLYLNISKDGTKSWLYRYQLKGKRRWMGLGSYHRKSNTLAMARSQSIEVKALVNRGIDPIEQQRDKNEDKRQADIKTKHQNKLQNMTFKVCSDSYIDTMKAQWSNAKHIQQWTNTIRTYAFPFIGDMPVKDIDIEHIKLVLDPIWETKTETANRVRQRIESILAYAIANKYRESSNPAIWKGLLDNFYPKPEKVKQKRYEQAGVEKHHNAIPYEDLPAFMQELRNMKGIAAKALQFTILTASRTGEVRFAMWDEFNLDKKEWNIPKSRMKARKVHRVALSDAAIELLNSIPKVNDYVFPGAKVDKPISDGAMSSVLKRMKKDGVTVHGFRSTFRDYIGEETGFPYRIAEFALAHGLTDDAEKAYARGDMLKKRFAMMNAWADYAYGHKSKTIKS